MHDPYLTLIGNLVDEPTSRKTKAGQDVANFRVASTSSRKEKESGEWVDNPTIFMTAVCYGALASNVASSLHKGEPVIVTGRLQANVWIKDEVAHTSFEIVVDSVGHDLTRGTGAFFKVRRSNASTLVSVGADGIPIDATEYRDDLEPLDFEAQPQYA